MNFKNILKKNKESIALITIFVLTTIIIGRPFNLLVNDDGIFIRNVKNFYDGSFSLHPLTAPTFYLQAITGFIATKIFGFNFEVLRILNIIFALATSITTFHLIKNLTKNNTISLIVVLAFISNPFFWFLSYSYMTEIHFFLLSTISFLLFFKYLQNKTYKNAIYLSIALSLLFLVRQIGLIFVVSFVFSLFITQKNLNKKDTVILLLPLVAFFWYQNFSKTTEYSEAGIFETIKNFFDYNFMVTVFLKRLFDSSTYYGLFIVPIIPLFLFNKSFYKNLTNYKNIFILTIIGLPFILKLIEKLQNHFTFPTLQNVFTLKGFYPSAIPSSDRFVNYPLFYNLHTSLLIMGILGFILSIFILITSVPKLKNLEKTKQTILIASIINIITITAITLAFRAVYDRYIFLIFFLSLIPLSFILNFKLSKVAISSSILLILLFTSVSIIFQKDYISWNQKRNDIITYATSKYNQNICDLEGVGEWEDYLYYECKDIQNKLKKTLRISWQDSDNIEGKNYIKLKTFTFNSPLGKQENKLYLLQKINYEN